jgi:hypothetical protein
MPCPAHMLGGALPIHLRVEVRETRPDLLPRSLKSVSLFHGRLTHT